MNVSPRADRSAAAIADAARRGVATVSAMTTTAPPATRRARLYPLRPFGILLVGVILVPAAITLLTNSGDTPDSADYVRMAFGTVAGQTIAILSALAVFVASLVRRLAIGAILANGFVALVVIVLAVGNIARAGHMLLLALGAAG